MDLAGDADGIQIEGCAVFSHWGTCDAADSYMRLDDKLSQFDLRPYYLPKAGVPVIDCGSGGFLRHGNLWLYSTNAAIVTNLIEATVDYCALEDCELRIEGDSTDIDTGNTSGRIDNCQIYTDDNAADITLTSTTIRNTSVNGKDGTLTYGVNTLSVAKTGTGTLTRASVRDMTNEGATGTVTLTLPAGLVGLGYRFTRVASQSFRINPNGTQVIQGGGAGKYLELDTDGDSVEIQWIGSQWYIVGGYGTYVFEQQNVTTTDATVTTLDTLATVSDSVYHATALVIAMETTDHDEMASYEVSATFRNDGGVLTRIGSAVTAHEDTPAWNCELDASGTDIRLRVTGAASTNINWRGAIEWRRLS
jgi:hypothetical protein